VARRGDRPSVGSVLRRCAVWANSRPFSWLGLLGVSLLVSAQQMAPIVNPDLGWHLALGRYIAATGSVPDTEVLTHTVSGVPTVYQEWLSQLVSFLVADTFGVLGLQWLYFGLTFALLVIVFVSLRRAKVIPTIALLGVVAYAIVAQTRFHVRPHMFSLALYALLYGYVFIGRPRLRPPELAAIFLGVALWANLHGSVLVFPALISLYVGTELLQQRSGWRAPRSSDLGEGRMSRLVLLWLVAGLASMATPHNIELIPYVVETFRVNTGVSREWLPISRFWNDRSALSGTVEAFWLLLAATFCLAVGSWRRISLSELAVVIAIACMPLSGYRHLGAYFAPVIFVFSESSRWLREASDRGRGVDWSTAASLAAIGSVAILTSQVFLTPADTRLLRKLPDAQPGFRQDIFPVAAAALMRSLKLESRLHHPERWGGYVAWETGGGYPVFTDGRWVTIGREVQRDSELIEYRLPPAFQMLEEYGVDLMLQPRGWMTDEIREQGEWLTLFENVNAGLYLRRTPDTRADLHRVKEYFEEHRVPFDSETGFDERHVFNQNRKWADEFGVRRVHLRQFRMRFSAIQRTGGQRVRGW
jgi:hypothetical protein